MVAVLERAQEIKSEREKALADYQAARTGGITAQAITRWLGKNIPRMFRR